MRIRNLFLILGIGLLLASLIAAGKRPRPVSQKVATQTSATPLSQKEPPFELIDMGKDSVRYLGASFPSQVYELDLNPTGSLSDDDLIKGMHERVVLLRRLNVSKFIYEIVGPLDFSAIGRISAIIEDPLHERVFIQEYVGRRYYTYWVIDAGRLWVAANIEVKSSEPIMPVIVSADGTRIYVSWIEPSNGDQSEGSWKTAIIDALKYQIIHTTTEFAVRVSSFGQESSQVSEDGKLLYTYRYTRDCPDFR